MKTILSIILLTFTALLTIHSQDLNVVIKKNAVDMADAMVKKDYNKLITYTYPKLIELIGGVDKMKESIIRGMDNPRAKESPIENIKIGEPSKIYIAGDELHCIVPDTIIIKIIDGHVLLFSNLLAVSRDKGQTWYFVDCNMGLTKIRELFPNFNSDLIIPDKQQPIKIKD